VDRGVYWSGFQVLVSRKAEIFDLIVPIDSQWLKCRCLVSYL
jgi:hypothetical protein